MKTPRQIRNPLTLIGVFAGIAEVAGTTVLPFLEKDVQTTFVWFVMLFPVLLVVLFFATLVTKPAVIYGPADYHDERIFASVITGRYSTHLIEPETQEGAGIGKSASGWMLHAYWKPRGTVSVENEKELLTWMAKNEVNSSIPLFLFGEFRDLREKAVEDLGLRIHNDGVSKRVDADG